MMMANKMYSVNLWPIHLEDKSLSLIYWHSANQCSGGTLGNPVHDFDLFEKFSKSSSFFSLNIELISRAPSQNWFQDAETNCCGTFCNLPSYKWGEDSSSSCSIFMLTLVDSFDKRNFMLPWAFSSMISFLSWEWHQAQDDIRAQVVTSDNDTLVCDFSLVYRNQDDNVDH